MLGSEILGKLLSVGEEVKFISLSPQPLGREVGGKGKTQLSWEGASRGWSRDLSRQQADRRHPALCQPQRRVKVSRTELLPRYSVKVGERGMKMVTILGNTVEMLPNVSTNYCQTTYALGMLSVTRTLGHPDSGKGNVPRLPSAGAAVGTAVSGLGLHLPTGRPHPRSALWGQPGHRQSLGLGGPSGEGALGGKDAPPHPAPPQGGCGTETRRG